MDSRLICSFLSLVQVAHCYARPPTFLWITAMLDGSCLCGAVSFEIDGHTSDLYQCHCSVCRKATGSSGISVFLTNGKAFRWLTGTQSIQLFKTSSGYRSVFCKICGSRLPDPNPDQTTFWIPAGLINQTHIPNKVAAHIYVGSKASWDKIGDSGIQHQAGFP